MKKTTLQIGIFLLILSAGFSSFAQTESGMGFIEVDKDIRLFYQKVGNGKQTVLVPLHLYMFEDFKHLAKGKTFIFYDVRNRGRSSPVADGAKISIQEDVEDVEKIRKHFKLGKISLIGESYVGLMIVMYAMKYPNNVERLIQIGAVPLKFGTEYPKEFLPNDEKPVVDPEEQKKVDELYKQGYHKTNPRDFCEKEWRFSQLRMVGNPANAPKVKSVCHLENEWAESLDRHFGFHFVGVQKLEIPKAEVAKVSVPVLTIHGTKDRNAVYGAGREWATLLPNARLLTVKGAAHFPWVDEPKLVFSSIKTFLAGKFPKEAEKLNSPTPSKVTNQSGFVQFNNGKLYYEIQGNGQPVVLISGGGGMDLRQWDSQFKFLEKHFQVIRYDVRGIGRSDTPSTPYSNVTDLKALLDFLGIEKATLVGLSLGGSIALDFALTHPERVHSLVLSGSLVRGFQISEELKKRVEKFAQTDKMSVADGVQVFLDDPYFVPAPDNPKARKIAKRLMIENARDIPPNLEQQLNPPTATRVSEIKHPTLILIGNSDHPDLHRRMDFLLEKISGSKKVVINGGGHILNLEKPKEFNQAVFDFLQTNNSDEK